MRSDLRHILHPSDSPSSSSSSTTALPATTSTSSHNFSSGHHTSNPPNSAPVSSLAHPVATRPSVSASAISESSFAVRHQSNDTRSRPEPPRLNHRRPSAAGHCTPSVSNSWTALNHSSSLSSILQDPADLKTAASPNPFQSSAHSSISSTRCPSTSRDSSGNPANTHSNSNSDQSTTCSTTNGKSSVQPTSAPTTPPSPSPSPIQQSGIARSPAPNYQSTATQTSFEFPMHSSPQPQPQERPTSSHTPSQIYPSPHAEPSSRHQSPSNPSSRSNTMHPVDRSSSLGLESVEAVTAASPYTSTHAPPVTSTNSRISDIVVQDESNLSSDEPCEMCIAQIQAHKDRLHLPREPPPNMAESQRKMGEFSDLVRNMTMRCEKHQNQQTGPVVRNAADEGLQARKRKEPADAPTGVERHVKTARFSSRSPPLGPTSVRGGNASSLPASFDSGVFVRRSDAPAQDWGGMGERVATILNMQGTAHRPYVPPPKDWQNMWHDVENEKKKEKKNRKDSVPVLPPAGDGVEVTPQ